MDRTGGLETPAESAEHRAALKAEAVAAFRAGDFPGAQESLRRYVCLFPDDPAGYGNLLAAARRSSAGSALLAWLTLGALVLDPSSAKPFTALLTAFTERAAELPKRLAKYGTRFCGDEEFALASSAYFHRLGRFREAAEATRRALVERPWLSRLYCQLGKIWKDGDGNAGRAFSAALFTAVPDSTDFADAAEQLAAHLHAAGDLPRSVVFYRDALRCRPASADVRANLAAALVDMGMAAEAEEELRRTLVRDPAHRDGLWLSSCLRIGAGDRRGGYRAHHVRWTEPHEGARTLEFGQIPLWLGQPPRGKRILVWGDFGIGDEIIFAPLAQWLAGKGAAVVLETDPRLATICARSFPGIKVVPRGGASADPGSFDFHVPSALLARSYEREDGKPELLPFRTDPARVSQIREALAPARGGGCLVGFAWGGGGARTGWSKSTELANWKALCECPGIRLVSLQYAGNGASGDFPLDILSAPVADLRNDLEGLAALLECLDATVSISGVNAHMAGALRRPGHILLPQLPLWFWGRSGERSDWYPSLRLFRRTDEGWGAPINALCASLRQSLSL